MVVVVQLCGPHTKHVAVMVSKELPQAAHVLILGLVTVLVCQVKGRGVSDSTEAWAAPTPWAPVDRSEGRHTPLLDSWYLRLAWALSRARDRYWLFSFSMSWLWVWGERRGSVGQQVPRAAHPSPSSSGGLQTSGASPMGSEKLD